MIVLKSKNLNLFFVVLLMLLVIGGVWGEVIDDDKRWNDNMWNSFVNLGTTEADVKILNDGWKNGGDNNREDFIKKIKGEQSYRGIEKLWNVLEEENRRSMMKVLKTDERVGVWDEMKYSSGLPIQPYERVLENRKEFLETLKGEEFNDIRNEFLTGVFKKINENLGEDFSVKGFPEDIDYEIDENDERFIIPASDVKEARVIHPEKVSEKVSEIRVNKKKSLVYRLGDVGLGDDRNWVLLQKKGVLEENNGKLVVRDYEFDANGKSRDIFVKFNDDKGDAVLFGKPNDLSVEKDILFKDESGADRVIKAGNHEFEDKQWMWGDVEIQIGDRVASPDIEDKTSKPRYWEDEKVVTESRHVGHVSIEAEDVFGLRGVMKTGVDAEGDIQEGKGVEVKIKETNNGVVVFGDVEKPSDVEEYVRISGEGREDDVVVISGKIPYAEVVSNKGDVARIEEGGRVNVEEGNSIVIIEDKSYIGQNGDYSNYENSGAVRVDGGFSVSGSGVDSGSSDVGGSIDSEGVTFVNEGGEDLDSGLEENSEDEGLLDAMDEISESLNDEIEEDCGSEECCPGENCDVEKSGDEEKIEDSFQGLKDLLQVNIPEKSENSKILSIGKSSYTPGKIPKRYEVINQNNVQSLNDYAKENKIIIIAGRDNCPNCQTYSQQSFESGTTIIKINHDDSTSRNLLDNLEWTKTMPYSSKSLPYVYTSN